MKFKIIPDRMIYDIANESLNCERNYINSCVINETNFLYDVDYYALIVQSSNKLGFISQTYICDVRNNSKF